MEGTIILKYSSCCEDLINILNEKIKELQLSIENGEIEDE